MYRLHEDDCTPGTLTFSSTLQPSSNALKCTETQLNKRQSVLLYDELQGLASLSCESARIRDISHMRLRSGQSSCEAYATPLFKQEGPELTHAHLQHTVVLIYRVVRVRRV